MTLNFGQIGPLTMWLVALELLESDISDFSRSFLVRSFLYLQIARECIKKFEFRQDLTIDYC